MRPAATVGGDRIPVAEVDRREARLRACEVAGALPAAGTSEGRQLRRWLTQLLVTERVVAVEAAARGIDRRHAAGEAATEDEVLPDATARLELGSVTSAVLASSAQARALFAQLTAHVDVTDGEIAAYHARNPYRFAPATRRAATDPTPDTATGRDTATATATATATSTDTSPDTDTGRDTATAPATGTGWDAPAGRPPHLDDVRAAIAADLRAAARRRVFVTWLDGRRAELVRLAPGYEHPGDPRQPDNTHRH